MLVPARDEEESLPGLLTALHSVSFGSIELRCDPIVVVDNGSRDGTARVAAAGGATVLCEAEPGYGIACLKGIEWLSSQEPPPDVILFVDADQSCLPGVFESIVGPVVSGEADLVLGVREEGGGKGETLRVHQRFGNRLVLCVVRAVFGWRFTDMPPLRAIDFSALRALHMDDRNWGWTLQMQLRARSASLRIVEQPIQHRDRTKGESKISGSFRRSMRVGWIMFRTIWRERLRHARRATAHH